MPTILRLIRRHAITILNFHRGYGSPVLHTINKVYRQIYTDINRQLYTDTNRQLYTDTNRHNANADITKYYRFRISLFILYRGNKFLCNDRFMYPINFAVYYTNSIFLSITIEIINIYAFNLELLETLWVPCAWAITWTWLHSHLKIQCIFTQYLDCFINLCSNIYVKWNNGSTFFYWLAKYF